MKANFEDKSKTPKFNRRKKDFYESPEIINQKEYFTFDPDLRKMINKHYFDHNKDFFDNKDILNGMDKLFESKENIIGSLNRVGFHQFKYNQEVIPMVHLFGMKLINKISEEEF